MLNLRNVLADNRATITQSNIIVHIWNIIKHNASIDLFLNYVERSIYLKLISTSVH